MDEINTEVKKFAEYPYSATLTLSIIIPAYNEQDNVGEAIDQIVSGIPASVADYEIIIIDDGSSDNTGKIIRALTTSRIRYLHNARNLGKGAALITGFQQARMEWILFTDADLQINISNLESFLEQTDNNDMIAGYRQMRRGPLSRQVISKIYNTIFDIALGFRLRDLGCPFKLFRRSFLNGLPLHSRGFFIDAELMDAAFRNGLRIKEMGVTCQPRQKGKSKVRLRHVLEMLHELLELLQRRSRSRHQ